MNTLRIIRRSLIPSTAVAVVVAALAPAASAGTDDANPALSIQASSSGYPVGVPIFASAMLGLGNAPTGTITFTLYGPSDPTCSAAPLFVSNVAVSGNGYYASAWYTSTTAGTHRWTARYLGDANNNPTTTSACSDPGGAVTMAKRLPTLRTKATVLGSLVSNEATLNGASPTGNLTFALYAAGNMTCAGAPIYTTVVPVVGSRSYTADVFSVLGLGVFQWVVSYSGDANNHAAGTGCADPANAANVTSGPTSTGPTVTVTPNPVRASDPLTIKWANIATPTSGDWYALYAVGAPDGTVLFWRYTGGTATGSASVTVPYGTRPGSYEVRLFANNSAQRLDVSDVITVVS